MNREYKTEIKKLLLEIEDDNLKCDIYALFADMHEDRKKVMAELSQLRRKHQKQQDLMKGIVRDLDFSTKYVLSKLVVHDECAVYYDTVTTRFSVQKVDTKLIETYELVGIYSAPYNRSAIKEDIKFVFTSAGKQST